MIPELKKYQINILGESYTILSDESEQEISKTVSYVDSLMKDVAGKTGAASEKVAVLVALKLAQKLLTLEAEQEAVKFKEQNILNLLDQTLLK